MEYLLQLLIEKIENSENQWKPGANGWKSLSNKEMQKAPPEPSLFN